MSDPRIAGVGKSLAEVRESLFGSSKPAKAFRTMAKALNKGEPFDPELIPLATLVVADLAGSQEFKARLGETDSYLKLSWQNVRDTVKFIDNNGWLLNDLKKWMDFELGGQAKRLSKDTSAFLREWVNTNNARVPTPQAETIQELKAFRPTATRIYYRGMRFHDIGELVQFQQTYGGTGKPFPFKSDWYSSWSSSATVAEKFGRYNADSSQNGAMMSWLGRMKAQKDYSGHGGYVIGARVAPDQCLVDLTNPELPFGGGQHGNEQEVIVLAKTPLVCKVYEIYGDVEREVEEYLANKYENTAPGADHFFSYLGPVQTEKIQGDETSGTVTFSLQPDGAWYGEKGKNPREVSESPRGQFNVLPQFRRRLYDARWLNDYTVAYKRMTTSQRVAARYWKMTE